MRNIVFHKETKTFHLYNEKISYNNRKIEDKLYYVRIRKRTYGTDLLRKENP